MQSQNTLVLTRRSHRPTLLADDGRDVTLSSVLTRFGEAARAFSRENGRPATLVIDDAELLLDGGGPVLIKYLASFAKVSGLLCCGY